MVRDSAENELYWFEAINIVCIFDWNGSGFFKNCRWWQCVVKSSHFMRMTNKRKIIVNLATSADGYIARPDGDIEWLTRRVAPKGFYGLSEFEQSIDTKLLGRKTYDLSLQLGAKF